MGPETENFSQQRNAGLAAFFHGFVVPEAALDFADVGAADHQHAQAGLADAAADGQGQLVA